ncbi:MAG TPA: adenylate/guanylate cyclase domain-containing protein [Allocoleopsis sp.]
MRQLVSHALAAFMRLLYKQTILVLTLLFCSGIAAALWNMSRLSIDVVRAQALQNAVLYAQAIQEARTLYSSDAVDRVKSGHGIILTDDYRDKEGAIPVPATFLIELGNRISKENPGMSVRLYSDFPFPSRRSQGGARDDFEREALRQLRQNPKQRFVRVENFQGRLALRYAQADIMKPSCIGCHNQTSPDSPKKDWKVGDVRGVLEITTPLDRVLGRSQQAVQGTFAMLAGFCVLGLIGITLVIGRLRQTSKELELRVIERTTQLQEINEELVKEQEKCERLLLNILPEPIAQQLKERTSHIADGFADVTILFADIVGFTQLSEQLSPTQLVGILNEIFSTFDRLTEQYGLEKIKTIGDAYMVVGGIPTPRSDHADAIAQMALDMRKEIARFNLKHSITISVRMGINTGPVVAGVIGTKKFIYDLWGDAVNTASRMESHGLAGCIQVTQATYELLQNKYLFQERGRIQIKGKGEMTTYLLIGKKEATLLA